MSRMCITEAEVTYVQERFTIKGSLRQLLLTPFRAADNQRRLTIEFIRQAHRLIDYWQKQRRTLRINENISFTNDDVMNYVIEALQ